jgi:peptide/nickel transport system permease protein
MTMRQVGLAILGVVGLVVVSAPLIAPNPPGEQFRDHLYAPPMRVRIVDANGRLLLPFVYPLRLVSRLELRYEEDRTRPTRLRWLSNGKLVRLADPSAGPLLLLGGDQLGRDVLARLILGARTSLGVALVAAVGAIFVGALLGAVAGASGGWLDELLMRTADFVLVLPAIYVVLALRALTPLVLPPPAVFTLMAGVFAAVGWPIVARGVRAIIASERRQDHAVAAVGLGLGPGRILTRHLLPATYGFLAIQATLLIPSFILAEATLSFVGLGFAGSTPSWGMMLQDASNVRAIASFPWVLSPALAIMVVVLGVNLAVRGGGDGHEPLESVRA